MKLIIEWENGDKHIIESDLNNFSIKNTDKNMMKSVSIETPPTHQLTDEEIWEVIERPELWDDNGVLRSCMDLCRAIEAKVRGK